MSRDLMKAKMENLLAQYGKIAFATYLVIFVAVLCSFAAAIQFGFEVEGVAGDVGTWGAAWLATKFTQPIRIGATLALTPVVARVVRRSPQDETLPQETSEFEDTTEATPFEETNESTEPKKV